MRLEDNLFFAVVGAGSDPHFTARRPLAAQGNGAGSQFRGNRNIKLQAAGDRQLIALQAKRQEARAVFFILGGDQGDFTQQATHKFAQLAVSLRRALRQAGVGHHQRNFTAVQGRNHVRPQFGFHHNHQLRAHGIEETVHGAG